LSPLADIVGGVVCDDCFHPNGRICPDCGAAHFDVHQVDSERCSGCLDTLSDNARSLAHHIAYGSDRVARDGTVDVTDLEEYWSAAEIELALELVGYAYEAGEIYYDPE